MEPDKSATHSSLASSWVWLALLTGSATLLVLLATWWWPLDLLTHFRVQYIWLLIPLCLLLLARKHYTVAAISAVCLAWNAVLVLPVYFGSPAAGEPQLRLMAANVLTSNRNYRLFFDAVREAEPDLLVVLEIDDAWQHALEELRGEYPHGIIVPREDNFGIALLSKLPLQSCKVLTLGDTGIPSIEATLPCDEYVLTILGTHPLPPLGQRAANRNHQLTAIARHVAGIQGPVIVTGDLNVTPWSPYFTRLLRDGKLHDSRSGFGVHATWPSHWGWAGIPIDHVLVSEQIGVIDRRIGADVGSDHRPVIVDLRIVGER